MDWCCLADVMSIVPIRQRGGSLTEASDVHAQHKQLRASNLELYKSQAVMRLRFHKMRASNGT